ncbi:hypothetical protein ACU686_02410 [Yinghuangia aomiensis]
MRANRSRRAVVIAAIGAIAVYSGIQLADASSSGSGSSTTAAATADPTPGPGAEAAAETGLTGPVEGDDAGAIAEGGPAAFSAAVTAAAPPSGLGWKSNAATNLLTTGYTFKFRDQRAADWLGPYVKSIAAQMSQITNIRYTVDTHPVGTAYQRAAGDVLVMLHNRPCKPTGGSGISTSYKGVTDGSGASQLQLRLLLVQRQQDDGQRRGVDRLRVPHLDRRTARGLGRRDVLQEPHRP